ncbi:hypothetical protein A0J48_018910 [Sphaerospermopsis aphanizomenoides BCCUSP55]|uniref:hypothetical protein n=1 Tax=Sphaerospermopsis aphanizomenoides TaxID=459663 RepID=UPI0019039C59|nr:hypothetical protein [Sphaerospermopsis aphanizomenoides]MBK1989579.1 hypothetical protein [Sphaerospermopsis aphanizomenoides BCCUSP55]
MKSWLNISFVTLLAIVSLQPYTQAVTAKNTTTHNFLSAQVPTKQVQTNAEELKLAVALPEEAKIWLKGGKSSSGRVVEIDIQQKKLWIMRSNKKTSIPLQQVEKVSFKNGSIAYRSNGDAIIRGERERREAKPVNWGGISLNSFSIKDATKGQAEVILKPPAVSPARLQGIRSVARNRAYVVDELQFNLQQSTINIVATPY